MLEQRIGQPLRALCAPKKYTAGSVMRVMEVLIARECFIVVLSDYGR